MATTSRFLSVRRRRPVPAASARRRVKNSRWENKFRMRMARLKKEMKEIGEDQRLIGEQQRNIRRKLEEIRDKCAQIRLESEVIFKQQASNKVLIDLKFKIFWALHNGDFVEATNTNTTF